MIGKRVLTALIGILAAIYIINFGQWLFAATVFLLALVAWHEFSSMMKLKEVRVSYALGIAGVTTLLACAWLGNAGESLAVILFLLFFCLMKSVISHSSFSMNDAAFTIMGVFYIGLPFSHMILFRFIEPFEYISIGAGTISVGAFYLWLVFIGTWASDTFAYLLGTAFGRHKLCPAISPKKTYEGALSGLLGSILAVAAVGLWGGLPFYHLLGLGILVGIFAPFGDLVESALKRFAGVKDSGGIFPGHGGVLDRFDAMMFSVPIAYYYMNVFF